MKDESVMRGRGVMSVLNGLHNACSPSNAETPALMRTEGAVVVGVADSKIKRYYLVREARRRNLTVSGKMLFEQKVTQKFFDIANDIFELEVWLRYPELAGKTIAVYDDWSIGPEMPDAETRDLFNPFEAKGFETRTRDTATTRKDVRLGGLLGTAMPGSSTRQ